MSTSVETQGLSIEEAIQLGLNALGTSRDRVEVEVIHHPRSGLLGIGARRAKVRVTLRDDPVQDGQEFDMSVRSRPSRRRRRRSGGRGSQQGQQRGAQKGERGDQKKQRDGGEREKQKGDGRRDKAQSERGRRQRSQQADRRRGGGRSQDQAAAAPREEAQRRPEASGPPPRKAEQSRARPQAAEAESSGDLAARASALADELMGRMGFEAKVSGDTEADGKRVVVHVEVDAEGLLIGRRGQTLDALEHVINRMLYAGETAGEGAVVLDVGGYRQRRRDSLEEMTSRLRNRALAESRAIQVSPMSPRDRQTVQSLLAKDSEVEVRVLGSGVYRRLQIVPVGVDPDATAGEGGAEMVDEQPPAEEGFDHGDEEAAEKDDR